MKKVLLLTDELLHGGVSKYVVDLSRALYEYGYHVTVAATDGPYRGKLHPGVQYVSLPLLKNNSYKKRVCGFFVSLIILVFHVKKERYGIIHSQKRYSDLLGRILSKIFKIPHLSTCHNTFHNLRFISVFGNYTIAVSRSIQDILISTFRKKPETVVTIYNGCKPLQLYSEEIKKKQRLGINVLPSTVIIASIGQFIPSKDRMTLLKALVYLKQQELRKEYKLLLVGDGPQKEAMLNYIESNTLKPFVTFLPANTDIEMVFNIADFCVLSSIQEGLPYVILEAASLKKPYIATDVGGVREFIEDSVTGILVPPKDAHRLALAIQKLIEDEHLRLQLGENAYRKYKQLYDFDQFITNTLSVYEKVLQTQKP